jgi:hypothetical protein
LALSEAGKREKSLRRLHLSESCVTLTVGNRYIDIRGIG